MSLKILYLSSEEFGSLTWSFERAFRELDCKVDLVDVVGSQELRCLRPGSILARGALRVLGVPVGRAIERRLLREYASARYDLVFFHKAMRLRPEVLVTLRESTGAKLVAYYADHPVDDNPVHCNNNTKAIIRELDCALVFAEHLVQPVLQAGARQVRQMPFAHDPALHYRMELTETDRQSYGSDIVFVGAYSKDRAEWFRHLLDFDLALWGPGWRTAVASDKRFREKIRGGAQVGVEFIKCYAAAKIGLNIIQSCQGGDGHNMRSFEAVACGSFPMCNRTNEVMRMFKEDEEIVCFSSPEELVQKVTYYLEQPEERQRVALNAWRSVQKDTYLARARGILELVATL